MWQRRSSFSASVVEPTLNCTELSIIGEDSQPFIFTGNNNSVQEYSYYSLNEKEEEKVQLPVFKTSQLRLLNRFQNYRKPVSYSVRSTNTVNCNFMCGTSHKMFTQSYLYRATNLI